MVHTLNGQIYDYNYEDVLCRELSKPFDEIQRSGVECGMLTGQLENFIITIIFHLCVSWNGEAIYCSQGFDGLQIAVPLSSHIKGPGDFSHAC